MKRKEVTRLFALMLTVILGLSACGKEGPESGGEDSKPSSAGQSEES